MEVYFATTFEDVRRERSFLLLISLTDSDTLRQGNFFDCELEIIKNWALGRLNRQRILKEHIAMSLLE